MKVNIDTDEMTPTEIKDLIKELDVCAVEQLPKCAIVGTVDTNNQGRLYLKINNSYYYIDESVWCYAELRDDNSETIDFYEPIEVNAGSTIKAHANEYGY